MPDPSRRPAAVVTAPGRVRTSIARRDLRLVLARTETKRRMTAMRRVEGPDPGMPPRSSHSPTGTGPHTLARRPVHTVWRTTANRWTGTNPGSKGWLRSMPEALQLSREINSLCDLLRKDPPLTLLEIGVYQGGSLALFAQAASERATIIGVDLNPPSRVPLKPGQTLHLVTGDSHEPSTLAAVTRGRLTHSAS